MSELSDLSEPTHLGDAQQRLAAASACGSACADALERLEAYLDGELPGTDVQEIAAHLTACYPCTDRATFEEQLRAIVRRDCVDDAPASLVDRIRLHLTDLPTG
jgi:mycothiol system anti-sigma-R factor